VPFCTVTLEPIRLPQRDPDIPLPPSFRLLIDGTFVTDTLFHLDHEDDPMQVAQCRTCASTWCEDGGAVVARRVGAAVVWMPPMQRGDDRTPNRFAPLPVVDHEPLWFTLAEYLKLPDARASALRQLSPDEGAWLLRCALRPTFGAAVVGPPTLKEIEASLLFRSVEPEGHVLAPVLLEAARTMARGVALTEVVGEAPLSSCRLLEGFDLPHYPTPSRVVAVQEEHGVGVWCAVGRGCWGRTRVDGDHLASLTRSVHSAFHDGPRVPPAPFSGS